MLSYFIAQIMPYITVTIFVLGILYRLGRWAGARIVHNITLSPWPQSNAEVAAIIGSEIIFFRSLFNFDRALWVGAWFMHIALFAVLGGHVMGIYFLGKQFVYIGMTEHTSEQMSNLLGTTMGLVMFAGLLYLLYRRVAIDKVRQVSNPSDYLHLLLILSIVSVGNFMRLFPGFGIEYAPVKEFMTHLFTLTPVPADAEIYQKPFFILHFFLVQILMIVFPFSKLLHVFGIFAERYIINRVYKDPAPGLPNVDVAAARAAGIGLPSGGDA
ncbi:respiratory nitrate reductase subunit gamma [Desulfurispora thermophila]|uniref:respiratory nitrate reductase subunit gamma n=1 Tax=Desulfurispora thermophila TaxID=265470 RepID=UPI00036F2779